MKRDKIQGNFSSESNGGTAEPAHITINVVPGPTSLARQQTWHKLWAKLITEVKRATMENNSSSDQTT